jgi:membrane-associated progesterone receptor component
LFCNFLFPEKYDYVGRLLKPGEQPRDYSDTEDEQGDDSKDKTDSEKKKD